MDKIKLGIIKEYAVIIEQKHNGGTTYEAIKIVTGHYNEFEQLFTDEEGNQYQHFAEYSQFERDKQYFIGYFKSTEYLEKIINENYDKFYNDYLSKFKKYHFQCRSNGIICIDKETGEKKEYFDDIVALNNQVRALVAENLEQIIGDIIEQVKEENNYQEEQEQINEESKNDYQINITKTPKEIVSEVTEYVKGQDKAIISIVTNIYQNLKFANGTKNNMLVVGPTGVGKTFIFEVLAKILDLPLLIYSVPGLTQSGYVGKNVDDILQQLITSCGGDISRAQHAIVVLDEFDKLAFHNDSNSRIGDEGVQNEFLKIIEGDKRLVTIGEGYEKREVEIDTSNIIFVGTGAFQKIFNQKAEKSMGFGAEIEPITATPKLNEEVLAKNGIKRELIGRMPIIIQLRKLEEQDLCDIIMNSKKSSLKFVEKLLTEECNIKINNLKEIVHKIAKDSLNKNIGARGINATIANMMNNIYYEVFNDVGKYSSLTFGENILTDPTDYKLTQKVKVRQLTKQNKL